MQTSSKIRKTRIFSFVLAILMVFSAVPLDSFVYADQSQEGIQIQVNTKSGDPLKGVKVNYQVVWLKNSDPDQEISYQQGEVVRVDLEGNVKEDGIRGLSTLNQAFNTLEPKTTNNQGQITIELDQETPYLRDMSIIYYIEGTEDYHARSNVSGINLDEVADFKEFLQQIPAGQKHLVGQDLTDGLTTQVSLINDIEIKGQNISYAELPVPAFTITGKKGTSHGDGNLEKGEKIQNLTIKLDGTTLNDNETINSADDIPELQDVGTYEITGQVVSANPDIVPKNFAVESVVETEEFASFYDINREFTKGDSTVKRYEEGLSISYKDSQDTYSPISIEISEKKGVDPVGGLEPLVTYKLVSTPKRTGTSDSPIVTTEDKDHFDKQFTEIGDYTYEVIISKHGFDTISNTYEFTVNPAVIEDNKKPEANVIRKIYDGNKESLLDKEKISNVREDDRFIYTITNEMDGSTDTNEEGTPISLDDLNEKLARKDIGLYKIDIRFIRKNYEDEDVVFSDPVYQGAKEKEVRTSLDTYIDETGEEVDTSLFKETNVAYIGPRQVEIAFDQFSDAEVERTFHTDVSDNTVDFLASVPEDDMVDDSTIKIYYRFENIDDEDDIPLDKIIQPVDSTASEDQLTEGITSSEIEFLQPGSIRVTAYTKLEDNTNYLPAEASMILHVGLPEQIDPTNEDSQVMEFVDSEMEEFLSASNDAMGQALVAKQEKQTRLGRQDIEYLLFKDENGDGEGEGTGSQDLYGLSINHKGEITVDDYQAVNEAMLAAFENGADSLDLVVQARMAEVWNGHVLVVPEESHSYSFSLRYGEVPSDQSIQVDSDSLVGPVNGWYTEGQTLSISSVDDEGNPKYDIGKFAEDPSSFKESTDFTEPSDGVDVQIINGSNQISKPIHVPSVKIDPDAPKDLSIEYGPEVGSFEAPTMFEPIRLFYSLDFENIGNVWVYLYARDDVSGVENIEYTFEPASDASSTDAQTFTRTVEVEELETDDDQGLYLAKVSLPVEAVLDIQGNPTSQYNGFFSFIAKDHAGNTSSTFYAKETAMIVDDINPISNIAYIGNFFQENEETGTYDSISNSHDPARGPIVKDSTDPDGVGTLYSPESVSVEVRVKEANFYNPEDQVEISLTKDGENYPMPSYTWTSSANSLTTDKEGEDTYFAEFELSEDGEYRVDISYSDYSGNEVEEPVRTGTIIIDTQAPEFTITSNTANQSVTFQVIEKYFDQERINISQSVVDINGNPIPNDSIEEYLRTQEWTHSQDGMVHEITVPNLIDGHYSLNLSYTDRSGLSTPVKDDVQFTIDTEAPSNLSLRFNDAYAQRIINNILYRFYGKTGPTVITLRASDSITGVAAFEWQYVREAGASVENRPSSEVLTKRVSPVREDGSVQIVLPGDLQGQFRGYIRYQAIDDNGNASEVQTVDLERFVYDTVNPQSNYEMTTANRVEDGIHYYNSDASVTLYIREANFIENEVNFYVSRNQAGRNLVDLQWDYIGNDTYRATYTASQDGQYDLSLEYTDPSGNQMQRLNVPSIIVDTAAPVISVSYDNNNAQSTGIDWAGNQRSYFDSRRTATITIIEDNFRSDEVEISIQAYDVAGNAISSANITESAWRSNGNRHTKTITFPGDGNYIFSVAYTDMANNEGRPYGNDYFTVDTTPPTNLEVSYSGNIINSLAGINYYNQPITVTISASDNISGIHSFSYSYINAAYASTVNAQLLDQVISQARIVNSNGGRTGTAVFTVPRGALGMRNQFNGNVEFFARDRALNSSYLNDGQRIIIDNISPQLSVTYSEPNNTFMGTNYYNDSIVNTIVINEANFNANDVVVRLTKDGVTRTITPTWTSNGDVHTGTFVFEDDGEYIYTVSYQDRSGNSMRTFRSDRMELDTVIEKPEITFLGQDGNKMAFSGDVIPNIVMSDENSWTYELSLTRDRYGIRDEDVTNEFLIGGLEKTNDGFEGSFDTFEKIRDNDGIYTLTAKFYDRAGNETTTSVQFSVNRFGSVYIYSDYLSNLIDQGGQFVQSVSQDLEVTEVNPDPIDPSEVQVTITRDGQVLEDVIYDLIPVERDGEDDTSWYEYHYVISKDNFAEDGVYQVTISSLDQAGNTPENTDPDQVIEFTVDKTSPEITSIIGLEEPVINAQEQEIEYVVFDALGISKIDVYVDDELVDEVSDFEDPYNYTGSFTIYEKDDEQNVRIVVTDMAGNRVDTEAASFTSAYPFHSDVLLSTDFLVRLLANPPLFWGLVALLVAIVAFLIFWFTRKKDENEEEAAA